MNESIPIRLPSTPTSQLPRTLATVEVFLENMASRTLNVVVLSLGRCTDDVSTTLTSSVRRNLKRREGCRRFFTRTASTSSAASLSLTDSPSQETENSTSASSLLALNDLPTMKCPRMSNMFAPYLSSLPNRGAVEDNSKNNRLLVDNGFAFPSQQGMFHFLPLGIRVLNKLKRVIVEELENVGCQELTMSTLTHSGLWQRSGRWDHAGPELFRLNDRRDNQLCLAPTCEENVTAMMGEIRKHISFKHLPIKLFQISTKYRDELNARNGLLRGREFLMKDLYTFDKDIPSSTATYSSITSAYERIFSRLSLPVYRVVGSPGKIGGRLSHEFQLPSAAGEDDIIICRNCKSGVNVELIESEEERRAWKCDCAYPQIDRTLAIELGHTFLLGHKYSAPFSSTFRNDAGKDVLLEMGCYGIGVSRLIGACAEASEPISQSSVEIVWPRAIAPFTVGVLPPKKGSKESTPEVVDAALQLVARLSKSASSPSSSEVLVDDRVEFTIGRRVRDMKRLGIPYIVVVGSKFKSDSTFELIDVYAGKTQFLGLDDLLQFLTLN